ncbi:MAG: TonB-dependent receptor [Proteobacteria bacterium]|nr:TonB-dependent receptor [Pseudomonadota bacterium]
MHTKQKSLSRAVRLALSIGLVSSATIIYAQDANQDNKAAPPKEAKTLQAIEVTGSMIRRVDTETASPVVTLSREALINNGNPTLGNILQALPSFGGFATNPQNNSNGGGVASPTLEGGDGASRISLRGLGDQRTLMLIDGHRLANADINMLPANMIQQVDVLASGATTAYGSDAIGGVANFILRKDFSGLEVSVNSGYSPNSDWSQSNEGRQYIKDRYGIAYPPDGNGSRRGIDLTVGTTGDQGNIVGGLSYNKYNPMLAPARKYSAFQYYLYSSGLQGPVGSSNIPTGKITIPKTDPLYAQFGCTTLTRGSGDGTSIGDYRCLVSSDKFNYAAFNYIQTEQERTNVFLLGNYKLTDSLTYYADFFYNHTSSAGQDAPPLTNTDDGWSVPANNPFNPFGVEFCSTTFPSCPQNVTTYKLSMRLTGAGTRLHTFGSDNVTLITGLKGAIGNTGWSWDFDINYGRATRNQTDYHEPNIAAFQKVIDDGGNPFDQTTLPVSITNNPQYNKTLDNKEASFNIFGDLFQMAAGPAQMSAGVLYRKQAMDYRVTSDAILDLSTMSCAVSAEACGSPGNGSFDVKELYGEALFPLLADAPLAKSLNVDIGVRYSDYDVTGSTTNWKAALEYKPVEDLLVRGTITQVFRSPNTDELYDGPTLTNPTNTDFCQNQTAAFLAAHTNGCQYVPVGYTPSGGGGQINALYEGGAVAGLKLKPEHGKSFDLGFVYSPSWAEGLSTTLDFWRITLNDLLTPLSTQTVFTACEQDDSSPYCGLIHRNPSGADKGGIYYVATSEVNLGNLSTSGVDFNVNYVLPEFAVPGRFKVGFESTYTNTYKVTIPNASNADYAGTYTSQFGNLSRLRATATLNWKYGDWSVQWQTRYINNVTVLNAYVDTGTGTDPKPSITYNSVKVGYTVPAWHTSFDVGVDNLFNRAPPLIYNGMNFNVDTATYDAMGRYVWARATVKF